MDELINELKLLQANVVAMYAQSHGYHWNVKGTPNPSVYLFR